MDTKRKSSPSLESFLSSHLEEKFLPLGASEDSLRNTVKLLEAGATVPFISRYRRKEINALPEDLVRKISYEVDNIKALHEAIISTQKKLENKNLLSSNLKQLLYSCRSKAEVNELYKPYIERKNTRASQAAEKGYSTLANDLFTTNETDNMDAPFFRKLNKIAERNGDSKDVAINHVCDVLAESFSKDVYVRELLWSSFLKRGRLASKRKRGSKKGNKHGNGNKYELYLDWKRPISSVKPYQISAINRGEKENFLSISAVLPVKNLREFESEVYAHFFQGAYGSSVRSLIFRSIKDSYSRLLQPSMERRVRRMLSATAVQRSLEVFAYNIRPLLLTSPLRSKKILGIDPGYKNGCKCAVIGYRCEVLETFVMFPNPPHSLIAEAENQVKNIVLAHDVQVVAIGNGQGCRETEGFISNCISKIQNEIQYCIVPEVGASVYSVSEVAEKELPELECSLRGAVSIARRLADPLSEYCKIEPGALGIGQYQHDLKKRDIEKYTADAICSCVNEIGVDLNTASEEVLKYVSGLNRSIAKSIVEFREKCGKIFQRKELLKVKGVGPKVYEQCSGFLRIFDGKIMLEEFLVHPDQYDTISRVIPTSNWGSVKELSEEKRKEWILRSAKEKGVSIDEFTLDYLTQEVFVERDSKYAYSNFFRKEVRSVKDVKAGEILHGMILNVVDFGVFADFGIGNNTLVHRTKLLKDDVWSYSHGSRITVRVENIDQENLQVTEVESLKRRREEDVEAEPVKKKRRIV